MIHENPVFDSTLVDDFEPRCPIVLLLDTSQSMKGQPIEELREGLGVFQDDLREDPQARRRVEVAVCAFGDEEISFWDFVQARNFTIPNLKARGTTPTGAAIDFGMNVIEQRIELYDSQGKNYYQPWIFLITDGEPTDAWRSSCKRIQKAQQENKIVFFVVGVNNANMDTLNEFSYKEDAKKLSGLKFAELFKWISQNLIQVSQGGTGNKINLTPTSGWDTILL